MVRYKKRYLVVQLDRESGTGYIQYELSLIVGKDP